MDIALPSERRMSLAEIVHQFAKDQTHKWLQICDRFLDWERDNILLGNPDEKTLNEHKEALQMLLRYTRLLVAQQTGPEFQHVADNIKMRLRQFEDSWGMFHDKSMSKDEAEQVLEQIFPE
jgi:hypothetical protein